MPPSHPLFVVFHHLLPDDPSQRLSTPATVRRSVFQQVAAVVATDLEAAFHLTNSLDQPWWEQPTVTTTREEHFRSTAVGDVIADPEGALWLVQEVGFAPVTWAEEPSPVIEFTVRLRVDDQPAFWRWALGVWQSQWGPHEELPESARTLAGMAVEALVLSNPTWGSELAIEFEDYRSRILEGHPFAYPDVLTLEAPEEA